MKRLLIALSLFTAVLSSCDKMHDIIHVDAYILSYVSLSDELEALYNETNEDSVSFTINDCFMYEYLGTEPYACAHSLREKRKNISSTGGIFCRFDKARYIGLRQKYNDFGYSPAAEVGDYSSCDENYAIKDEIRSIFIVSDTDWDASHSAGTSLNDVFEIEYNSLYPFITNGYDESLLCPVRKPLSTLKQEDLVLLTGVLKFYAKRPDNSTKHTLTITLSDDSGLKRTVKTVI